MTIAFRVCGNMRTAALTAIYLTILINTFDTTSDLCLVLFYISHGLPILALSVAISDYFPGILVLTHHFNSDSWRASTVEQKCYAVCVLALQPFTALVTNIAWLCNIASPQQHRLARISTVLHGAVEAPVQCIILFFVFSKSILPLPWSQSTSVVDSRGNILSLGNISIFSLVLTMIGLLKASCEIYELDSFKEQIFASIFSCAFSLVMHKMQLICCCKLRPICCMQ